MIRSIRICFLLGASGSLFLPLGKATDRNTDNLRSHSQESIAEAQVEAEKFGFPFVWQSSSRVAITRNHTAGNNHNSFIEFPNTKRVDRCIKRCYAQSARLGSYGTDTDSTLCWCNTNIDCVEEQIMFSGGFIFSITEKAETNLCSFQNTHGATISPSPIPTQPTNEISDDALTTTPYPSPSTSLSPSPIPYTAQTSDDATTQSLFAVTKSPSPGTSPPPIREPSPPPTAKAPVPELEVVRSSASTLSPSSTASIIEIKGRTPTIQPSVSASPIKGGTPTIHPSGSASPIKIVGNWAEIPPFSLELSFTQPSNSVLSKDAREILTLYLSNYFSQWLINNTNIISDVDIYLDTGEVTRRRRQRSLVSFTSSTQVLQFSGGYAIFYSHLSRVPSQSVQFDKCQIIVFLTLAISGFVSFLKDQLQTESNLGTLFSNFSGVEIQQNTLSIASSSSTTANHSLTMATLPPTCDMVQTTSPLVKKKSHFTATILATLFAFVAGTTLGVAFVNLYKRRRSSRQTVSEGEIKPSESCDPYLPKLGTSQSTEVATNVQSSRKSVVYVLSGFNNTTSGNRSTKTSVSSWSDVDEFSQGFQVVAPQRSSNSQYISPASSTCDEEQTLGFSISEAFTEDCVLDDGTPDHDDADSFDWEDGITHSVDDGFSVDEEGVFNYPMKSIPSYDDVPSDEERMDGWRLKHTASVTNFVNYQSALPNEEEYHDVLDMCDTEPNTTQPPWLQKQSLYSNTTVSKKNKGNNSNSKTYEDGMVSLFLQQHVSTAAAESP